MQGLLGGVVACGAMLFINRRWTSGVRRLPGGLGFDALVVVDGYQTRP